MTPLTFDYVITPQAFESKHCANCEAEFTPRDELEAAYRVACAGCVVVAMQSTPIFSEGVRVITHTGNVGTVRVVNWPDMSHLDFHYMVEFTGQRVDWFDESQLELA